MVCGSCEIFQQGRGAPSFTVHEKIVKFWLPKLWRAERRLVTQKIVTCVSSSKTATKAMVHTYHIVDL